MKPFACPLAVFVLLAVVVLALVVLVPSSGRLIPMQMARTQAKLAAHVADLEVRVTALEQKPGER